MVGKGASSIDVKSGHTTATTSGAASNSIPIAKGVPSEGKVEVAASVPVEVAQAESEDTKWFWRMLELAGYERW